LTYPSSPPNAYVVRPYLSRGTPHTLADQRMCYLMPAIDWNDSLTSYIAVMIQTWLYANCNWSKTETWDWYQDDENIPLSEERYVRNDDEDSDYNASLQHFEKPTTTSEQHYRIPIYSTTLNYDITESNDKSENLTSDGRLYTNEIDIDIANTAPRKRVNVGKIITIIILSAILLAINVWSFVLLPLLSALTIFFVILFFWINLLLLAKS